MIEANNPDIDFDWTRILKGEGEPVPERREETRRPQAEELPAFAPSIVRPEELRDDESPALVASDAPASPAEARLGAEGLGRLRGRYAEVLARITERVADLERQAELKSIAERLNPDAWVTEEDVRVGLEGYEANFESLRGVVGHRRRRRRRRGKAE